MVRTVGIRELKNKLSEYLRHVREGDAVIVTDRGVPIAQICAPGDSKVDHAFPRLQERASRGGVRLGLPNRRGLYPQLGTAGHPGLAASLLDEDRGDR